VIPPHYFKESVMSLIYKPQGRAKESGEWTGTNLAKSLLTYWFSNGCPQLENKPVRIDDWRHESVKAEPGEPA
jgi:hypothetical protein